MWPVILQIQGKGPTPSKGDFFIKNDEFCIKNDDFAFKMKSFVFCMMNFVLIENDEFRKVRRGRSRSSLVRFYIKMMILYKNDDFPIKNDDSMLRKC